MKPTYRKLDADPEPLVEPLPIEAPTPPPGEPVPPTSPGIARPPPPPPGSSRDRREARLRAHLVARREVPEAAVDPDGPPGA